MVIKHHEMKLQAHPFDAGLDLFPGEIDKVTHHGHNAIIWVHTSVIAGIGPGSVGILEPRSSSMDRLCGGEVLSGVIDAGYRCHVLDAGQDVTASRT